jgi:hypothetical protein
MYVCTFFFVFFFGQISSFIQQKDRIQSRASYVCTFMLLYMIENIKYKKPVNCEKK